MTGLGGMLAMVMPLLQAQSESLMTDTCVVRRRGADVLDHDTDLYVPAWTEIYSGPCKLRFQSAETQSREVAEQQLVGQQLVLSLPYGPTATVRVDDVATVTSQGLEVRIAGRFVQTYATARRFPVEALS